MQCDSLAQVVSGPALLTWSPCMEGTRPNKALQQTKGAKVRAARHSAGIRRGSMPRCTFFTNVPSQLNAVLAKPSGRALRRDS